MRLNAEESREIFILHKESSMEKIKIGNVEFKSRAVLAPMAGITDRAYRELCVEFGAAYCVSEMVSSKALSFNIKKSEELMEISDYERPCGIQIFGDDPKCMAEAAVHSMENKPDIIDINMGCPAPKISSNGSGSALMKNPLLCGEIVKAVTSAVDVPVTVKIRKGWNNSAVNAVEVAKICEQAGAAAITIHGRTREQYYKPPVDYDIIKEVNNAVSIPVIANGDITSAKIAKEVMDYTGCQLVMVGRASLGNPWIFSEINAYLENPDCIIKAPTLEEKLNVMCRHIEKMVEYKGEHMAMLQARKTDDVVESIGVNKAKKLAEIADLVIYVVDSSRVLDDNDYEIMELIKDKKVLVILNKADLAQVTTAEDIKKIMNCETVTISAKQETGIEELEETVKSMFFNGEVKFNEDVYITSTRHKELLKKAENSLKLVLDGIDNMVSEDFLTIDLMAAYENLGLIIGEEIEDDLANRIFSKFCMGK